MSARSFTEGFSQYFFIAGRRPPLPYSPADELSLDAQALFQDAQQTCSGVEANDMARRRVIAAFIASGHRCGRSGHQRIASAEALTMLSVCIGQPRAELRVFRPATKRFEE